MKPDEERFDIYDDKMNPAGTAARQVVHAQGLWHRTFQCWIISDQDECPTLLFQKRHPDKDTYPGLLDISCAGHLQAGEGIEDGVRELKEELGIEVSFEELEPRGIYYAQKQPAPDLIDREICHVFIYRSDQALASYRLQTAEVTGLYRVKLEDVKRLIRGFQEDETIEAEGVELDKQGDLQYVVRCYGKNDFVPHTPEYFELIINF